LGSSRVPPASDKGSAELDVHWLFVAGGSCAQVDAMSYEALTSVQWAVYNRMHRFSIFFLLSFTRYLFNLLFLFYYYYKTLDVLSE
jgi:hypothetical protein